MYAMIWVPVSDYKMSKYFRRYYVVDQKYIPGMLMKLIVCIYATDFSASVMTKGMNHTSL